MQGTAPSGAAVAKTATRWILYGKPSGGYRLESEIENQPAGMRVLQIEELTEQFVPTVIGYELYRNDSKGPAITARCDFSTGAVICKGNSGKDQSAPSDPYKPDGPFWMWIEGLFSLDMPWLFDGALNMSHPGAGKASIEALIVSGGSGVMIGDAINIAKLEAIKRSGQTLTVIAPNKPIPWSFSAKEKTSLQFVGSETSQINGTNVAVTHYGPDEKSAGGLWIAGPGLLTRLSLSKDSSYILYNYKQYRKLIPELPVETGSKSDAHYPECRICITSPSCTM